MKRFMSALARNTLAAITVATLGTAGAIAAPAAPSNGDRTALQAALDDEYRAEATYQAVIDKFGPMRPFSNIIWAEQQHARMVTLEMQRLGMAVPANPYTGKVTAPATLLDACKTGIAAEKDNVALYDRLLPTVKDRQIRGTLEMLQAASRERHLPAFERCVAFGGTMGGMMGRGPGGGW